MERVSEESRPDWAARPPRPPPPELHPASAATPTRLLPQVAIQAGAAGFTSRLPRGASLVAYVRSVLQFMATTQQAHAARTAASMLPAAAAAGAAPLTLLAFDDATQSYRWLGTPEQSTNESLAAQDVLHYHHYLHVNGGAPPSAVGGGRAGLHSAPVGNQRSVLTLPPGSAEQLAKFRAEEAARYANPAAPFAYTRRDGARSAVAPLSTRVGKAREHFLLVPERPQAMTLLSLVRDAAARLPGGVGSRTDVCELMRESAYVVAGVNDAQLATAASGTLDRLQGEEDSCLRYDPVLKRWNYLHAERQAHEFRVV